VVLAEPRAVALKGKFSFVPSKYLSLQGRKELDVGPTFAKVYVGRKRTAQPLQRLRYVCKRLQPTSVG
jgi:hypothetical protein